MKKIFKKQFFIMAFLSCLIFLPAKAAEYTLDDPFAILKQEISEHHEILSFETRRISAKYPSEVINKLGLNFPGYRGPGQLVIYYPKFNFTTGTNEFGTEAVVENGVVTKLSGANSIIPKNGFVISGHGSSKTWIKNHLKIGTNIIIEGNTIIAYTTPDSYIFRAKEKIKQAEEFIDNAKKYDSKTDDKKAAFYLKKAKAEVKKAEKVKESLKMEYSNSAIKLSNLAIKYALPYIEEEFKGVWLRPKETSVYEVRKTLSEIQATGIQDVFLETYFHGYTIYPSKVMKRYEITVQNPKFLSLDLLKAYTEEAHKKGMRIHCWFESFYIGNNSPIMDNRSILYIYPSWGNRNLANYNEKNAKYVSHSVEHNGYFLDPANPEVTGFLLELIGEIVTNYKVDGINLDYTRYPTSQKSTVPNFEQSNWGYTEIARNEFKELYEIDPIEIKQDSVLWKKWGEYRQDKIYEYVKNARQVVPKNVFLSAVIFPDYEVCLDTKQQDWAKWSKEELVDAMTPLIMTSDNELFSKILKDVKSRASNKTEILTGLFVGFLDAEPEDLLRQISASRGLKSKGVVLFDWAHLPVKYQNALKYRVFVPKNK